MIQKLKYLLLFFLLFEASLSSFSQSLLDTKKTELYQSAYTEICEMLSGKKTLNLKRAIFITENAYVGGTMNYMNYDKQIKKIAFALKQMIKDKHLEGYKTAGNWAAFVYMTDSITYNNNHPYSYDFVDFFGDSSWTSQFVTKLLNTHVGNCHSLPLLYKVLCDEIGAKSYIAFAPSHLYIKHQDENGKWVNLEMTNGSFSRDEWIMEQSAITIEQIKSGIYMNATTEKELIAFMLFDLQSCYQRSFSCDSFQLKMIETGLAYFPNCINLQLAKAFHYQQVMLKEKKQAYPNTQVIKDCIAKLKQQDKIFEELGYNDESPEHYEAWIKSVEEEKLKRNIK